MPRSGAPALTPAIQQHYDSLAHLYRLVWGDHIHHGLWSRDDDPPRRAQEQLVRHLADAADVRTGARLLDIGCGYGASGRWLAAHRRCRVVGVTISGRQARLARRLGARDTRPAIVRADAAALPFAPASFDVVWVIECLEHLEKKADFLRAVRTCLRPGGRLALCSWQRREGAGRRNRELIRQVCEAFLCPSLATEAEHRAWCHSAGLRVTRIEDLTARVRPTWEVLSRRVRSLWLAPLRWLVGATTHRFVEGFGRIAEAYDTGAMSYGLFVAERPDRRGVRGAGSSRV